MPGGWRTFLTATASLYVHIPFCRRMCWYCGCNTSITQRDEPVLAYAETASRPRSPSSPRLSAGGRPSSICTSAAARPPSSRRPPSCELMESLRAAFDIRQDAEVAIEIDPRTLSPEMVGALADAGMKRASLGVQSLDPVVQKAIGREQSFGTTAVATEWLRRAGLADQSRPDLRPAPSDRRILRLPP